MAPNRKEDNPNLVNERPTTTPGQESAQRVYDLVSQVATAKDPQTKAQLAAALASATTTLYSLLPEDPQNISSP